MNIPCCDPCVSCESTVEGVGLISGPNDPNNPLQNISAAAPDSDLFIGRHYTPPGTPPIGSIWYAAACNTYCLSAISQQDANDCAQRLNLTCISNNWPTTNPNPGAGDTPPPGFPAPPPTVQTPRPVFYNTEQSCSVDCDDGTPFTFTVPAGTFAGLSQQAADQLAMQRACQEANLRRICIGDMNVPGICSGEALNDTILVEHNGSSMTASVSDGSLPPGVSISNDNSTITLSGTPTAGGEYEFTISVVDNLGNVKHKDFTFTVLQISPTSLPAGTIGNPYSQAMSLVGASGSVSWSATNLPPGLTINSSSGLISGTPTGSSGSHLVTITASYAGFECSEDYTLTINGGVDWSQLTWNVIVHTDANGGSSSGFPNSGLQGSSFTAQASAPYDAALNVSARTVISGTMMYSGPAINAEILGQCLVNNLILGQGGSTFFQIAWYKAGAVQGQVGGSNPTVGALNLPVVSAAIGAPTELRIDVDVRATDGGVLQSNPVNCSGSGSVVNV